MKKQRFLTKEKDLKTEKARERSTEKGNNEEKRNGKKEENAKKITSNKTMNNMNIMAVAKSKKINRRKKRPTITIMQQSQKAEYVHDGECNFPILYVQL